MNLKQAITEARREVPYPMTDRDRKLWHEAEAVLIDAGICPGCIQDNHKAPLGKWEPGDYWHHAGRRCLHCEEFFPCGEQPEYDTSPDCFSDADSGL